jgi:hypothetical protein
MECLVDHGVAPIPRLPDGQHAVALLLLVVAGGSVHVDQAGRTVGIGVSIVGGIAAPAIRLLDLAFHSHRVVEGLVDAFP